MAKMQFLSPSVNSELDQHEDQADSELSWQLRPSKCHNCDWIKTSLPFVCKVIRHIHELEDKTEIWFRKFTESVHSLSKRRDPSLNKPRNVTLPENSLSQTSVYDDSTYHELCIKKVRFDGTASDVTAALHEEARIVLSEIIGLMEQLEAECQKTNESLKLERERVTNLGNRIDQLSCRWMKVLPEAVQREYNTHLEEINELELHAECKASNLTKLQNQVNEAKILNQRFREEINFVKKLDDYLKEKLDLEKKTIDDILPNQMEMTERFNKVDSELKEVQLEFDNATADAHFEQIAMKTDLLSIENNTVQLHKDIITAKTLFEVYTAQLKEIQDQLAEAEKTYEKLTNEFVDLDDQKNIMEERIKQLKAEDSEKLAEINILTDACNELDQTIKINMRIGNNKLSKERKELDRRLNEFANFENGNTEFEKEIEMLNSFIKESRQEKNKMKKEMRQVQEALKIKTAKLASMKKQLSQVEKTLTALRTKLATLKKTISDQEAEMRDQIAKLRKKIKGEMIQRTKLQSKVKLDAAELIQYKESNNRKKRRAANKVAQVEKIVENIEKIFKDLEAAYAKYHELFLKLKKLEELSERHHSATVKLENENKDLKNELTHVQDEYLASTKLLDHTIEQIKIIQENIHHQQNFKVSLLKDIEKYKNIIEDLQPIVDMVTFKHTTASNLISNLKSEIAEAKKRKALMEDENQKLLANRKEKSKEVRDKLASALLENETRTSQYKQLQGTYLEMKDKLANIYYDRLKTEGGINNYLHGDTAKSIQRVSTFLQTLTDFCDLKDYAENNQCGIIKDKKSHGVQVTV
ncbi:uncharacterized protein ccdc178 isoform X2 [Rhinoraja longicauda]